MNTNYEWSWVCDACATEDEKSLGYTIGRITSTECVCCGVYIDSCDGHLVPPGGADPFDKIREQHSIKLSEFRDAEYHVPDGMKLIEQKPSEGVVDGIPVYFTGGRFLVPEDWQPPTEEPNFG